MTTLKQLFERGQAGLTVYSPDGLQSRLTGNLDHFIHKMTDFEVIHRQWIHHTVHTLMPFYDANYDGKYDQEDAASVTQRYDAIPLETLQYGHLVVKLFLSGPSLLTLWRGEDVIPKLAALKGATHPAEANSKTVRGSFWCDNAVCNLMHSSDDAAQAERELKALQLGHLLDESFDEAFPLMQPNPAAQQMVRHSGW